MTYKEIYIWVTSEPDRNLNSTVIHKITDANRYNDREQSYRKSFVWQMISKGFLML